MYPVSTGPVMYGVGRGWITHDTGFRYCFIPVRAAEVVGLAGPLMRYQIWAGRLGMSHAAD